MRTCLDWSAYEDAGIGDAYADIPRHGDNLAKAVAVCIGSRQCEIRGKGVMCPSCRLTGNPSLSTGGRVLLLKAALNAELVANAFSCRQQIRAHAGRRARHLASVLRDALSTGGPADESPDRRAE
jgi:hypothetical protein